MAPLHKEYTIIINQVQKLPDHEIKKIEMLKNEADFIQEKIDSYDISVTTVLNDMITKLSYKDTKKRK
jgi:hypothetical protein